MTYQNNVAVGFTQLYVLFSSVSLSPIYVLNDLYTHPDYRGNQIGTTLINQAKAQCRAKNYKGLIIQTEATNPA
ncbi:GNAT family N-acetyltransferase [Changchengzhania lutea]|uniref:GNAT family N-acetyltransferase n=1 Tax=Changchengzhania lutea TaxID=2049305 RepID=UPI001FE5D00A|nr:GNAT family N-acetyltransferase [Changchengzhania lutea]